MYGFILAIIDDVLMSPQLAPFTTFGLVILIALVATNVLAGGNLDDLDIDDEAD